MSSILSRPQCVKDEMTELIAKRLMESDQSMRTLAMEINNINNRINSVMHKLNTTNGYQLFPGPVKYAHLTRPLAVILLMIHVLGCELCYYRRSRKGHQKENEVPLRVTNHASKHYKVGTETPYDIECVETIKWIYLLRLTIMDNDEQSTHLIPHRSSGGR